MQVMFWGTRGSIPVSGSQFVRHGGSTTCLEIRAGGERIVIDCGTGLAQLGKECGGELKDIDIYQTHMHWDHVQGFPFFGPLFNPEASVTVHAVNRQGQSMCDVLNSQMSQPTFPVGLDIIPAALEFDELEQQGVATHGEVTVRWEEVIHPGGSTAYRFEHDDQVIVFSGDVEVQKGCMEELIEFSQGADILIMDSQYFPSEYVNRQGFGHSTPIDAVNVALQAGVKRLVLTHHDPSHDDDKLMEKLELAREYAADSGLLVDNAYDGMLLSAKVSEVVPGNHDEEASLKVSA